MDWRVDFLLWAAVMAVLFLVAALFFLMVGAFGQWVSDIRDSIRLNRTVARWSEDTERERRGLAPLTERQRLVRTLRNWLFFGIWVVVMCLVIWAYTRDGPDSVR